MKKSELKTGMVVETEAEVRYQVMLNTPHGDVLQGDDGYNKLSLYKEDLKVSGRTSMGFDIVAVYSTPSDEKGYRRPLSNFTNCLWRRKITITINPEETKTMKKSELKTGMVVELCNGGRYQVMLNTPHGDIFQAETDGTKWSSFMELDEYDENLQCSINSDCSIMRVWGHKENATARAYSAPFEKFTRLLWKRPDAEDRPKLDPKPVSFKEFLKLAELFYGRKVTITINPEE